ncbi:MAG TPA: response regulator transcription factor [Ktedonobacteraceae bacterium]|nr:response regulator transcription factor [Ktedonobacteraceae bacterium]
MVSAGASSQRTKTKADYAQAQRSLSAELEHTQEKNKQAEREPITEAIAMQLRSEDASQIPIRVLIVDDHEVVRKGLCAALGEERDFVVVGEADSGHAALVRAQELQPDIVLLDIFLGTTNGLDIAQQLQRACPASRIVILTGLAEEDLLLRAMRIGVQGYLQKSLPLAELLSALRTVHQGERVIGEQRAITQVLDEFHRLTREQDRTRSGLSELEIELVRLAAQGCSNKEIAARQFWSEVTVKRKMQDIYRKLQVTDRAQAVAEAIRTGLI